MALELVGGALLSAFLQVAFEELASPQVLNFFRGRKLDQKLLNNLEIKLQSIHALADDAEQKQFRDQRVRNWLLKVKDVVLDAEDLLDEIQRELSKAEDEAESDSQTCTCKVPNFFKSSPDSSFNKEIKTRMEQILGNLESLASQQSALGLKNASGVGVGPGFGSELSPKWPSTSLVVESVIYGRDNDKEIILNWLTSDTDNGNKLSILSIVGMGGMGKTTLARHVYNDPRIEGKFDSKAWVCVSDDFDVFKVTRTVLERITGSTDDSRDLEMVQGRLKEKLIGKRFLLVLDDVWNEKREEWEAVLTPLINFGAQGSRILATTRNKNVASTMRSKEHHLELLQEDYCWQLFVEHAFQSANQLLKLNSCRYLKELPLKLHMLTNLHRLELIETELRKVPPYLGKLKNLQVLMILFDVGKSREFSFQELGELNLHGSLTIKNLQNIENPSDALMVDLKNKTQLVELVLESGLFVIDDSARERDETVIENLQPSKHLEKLSIRKYGGKQFPCWLSDNLLWNMVSLTLEQCHSCQRLPSFCHFSRTSRFQGLMG